MLVFFDDILIYSCDRETHLAHLQTTFQVLSQHHLIINQKKCSFGCAQVEYLGHIISVVGVVVDPSKVEDMLSWPPPKDVKGLRGFLGLTVYYRRFVEGYGKIVEPLTRLLKKDSFEWNNSAQEAFDRLKTTMTMVLVLAMLDFSKTFIVETDASGVGVGAVLMQDGRPIVFISQALSPMNKAKSVYERELMAIVFAIQKW